MALTEQEKERIIEEEKLRLETRKQQMQGGCSRGRCGYRCGGWRGGIFKILVLGLILAAIFWHPWHPGYGYYRDCGYDRPAAHGPAPETPPRN